MHYLTGDFLSFLGDRQKFGPTYPEKYGYLLKVFDLVDVSYPLALEVEILVIAYLWLLIASGSGCDGF